MGIGMMIQYLTSIIVLIVMIIVLIVMVLQILSVLNARMLLMEMVQQPFIIKIDNHLRVQVLVLVNNSSKLHFQMFACLAIINANYVQSLKIIAPNAYLVITFINWIINAYRIVLLDITIIIHLFLVEIIFVQFVHLVALLVQEPGILIAKFVRMLHLVV